MAMLRNPSSSPKPKSLWPNFPYYKHSRQHKGDQKVSNGALCWYIKHRWGGYYSMQIKRSTLELRKNNKNNYFLFQNISTVSAATHASRLQSVNNSLNLKSVNQGAVRRYMIRLFLMVYGRICAFMAPGHTFSSQQCMKTSPSWLLTDHNPPSDDVK